MAVISLHGFTIIGLCIFLIIPKFVISVRKGRYNFILPSVACLIGEVLTFISLVLSETVTSEYTIMVMDYVSLSFGAIALYSWFFNWLRVLLTLKNHGEEPKYLKWIHFMVITTCLAVALGAILIHNFTTFEYIFLVIYSLLSIVTVLSFASLTLFMFRTMKKFSDVNVFKSSLIQYLIFMSVLIAVAPSTKILEIAFIFTSLAETLRYMFLFILFVSVAFMDSSREEISEVYKKFWKICKRERYIGSHGLSEQLLNEEMNDSSSTPKVKQ